VQVTSYEASVSLNLDVSIEGCLVRAYS
jgi:hypothetical protein